MLEEQVYTGGLCPGLYLGGPIFVGSDPKSLTSQTNCLASLPPWLLLQVVRQPNGTKDKKAAPRKAPKAKKAKKLEKPKNRNARPGRGED